MRPIDADKISLTDFEIVMCNGNYKIALEMLLQKIEDAPTLKIIPIEWLREKTIGELLELSREE